MLRRLLCQRTVELVAALKAFVQLKVLSDVPALALHPDQPEAPRRILHDRVKGSGESARVACDDRRVNVALDVDLGSEQERQDLFLVELALSAVVKRVGGVGARTAAATAGDGEQSDQENQGSFDHGGLTRVAS